MTPEDQAKLLRELSEISTAIATTDARSEERFRNVYERLKRLEDESEATGEHQIEALRCELRERKAEANRWKWWLLGIAATLITSAVTGLVVYFLTTR
jgi:uncharacterized coiled-coil protein SlyX